MKFLLVLVFYQSILCSFYFCTSVYGQISFGHSETSNFELGRSSRRDFNSEISQPSRRVERQGFSLRRNAAKNAGTINFGETGSAPTSAGSVNFESGQSQSQPLPRPRPSHVAFPQTNFQAPMKPDNGSPCQSSSNGEHGNCQERIKCSLYYGEYTSKEILGGNNKCQLGNGRTGVCCPIVTKNKEVDVRNLIRQKDNDINLQARFGFSIESRVAGSVKRVNNRQSDYNKNEERLLKSKSSVKLGSSSHGHLLFFQTSRKAIELSKLGYSLLQSSQDISTRLGINKIESGEGLQSYNLKGTALREQCPVTPACDPRKIHYRNVDGSCNNLRTPALGSSFTPLYRIILPDYADGIWTPRVATDLSPLPSARKLSSSIILDQNSPDTRFSLYVMQFGQFIDHDLSHVPIYRYYNGSGIECCTEDGDFLPLELQHPFCLPIEIPANDRFYRQHRQRCMNFVRSMVGPRIDCSLGYADQLSQITHWLDNSNVYGSTNEEEEELRLFRDGKLRAGKLFSGSNDRLTKGMLPIQEKDGDECTNPDTGTHCFNAGDLRVNEMIGLTATHLIWFREHNRIATELKIRNPSWNDEQLFQEARRLLNAEYQHILYNEWLPIVLGRKYMESFGILPLTHGYSTDYNDRIDPSVSNAFAAAAFRMGHTLIQGILHLINEVGVVDERLEIHNHFNNPFRIREEGILDKIIRTLTNEPIQAFDPFITTEVTNRLFQPRNKTFGMDLISLNIQRARDHGVPGYNYYRDACKLGRADTFARLTDMISPNMVQIFTQHYKHVDDIDLFIGGVAEKPLPGALLGPTFTCIIGDQFARSKKSDRFAYDLGGLSHSFSPVQLDQIRRVSFARILCDNSDRLHKMQPLAFFLPNGDFNPLLDCASGYIPRVDLSFWKY